MSDAELLRIRVRVQRALTEISRPRSERDDDQVTAALREITEALSRAAVPTA